MWDSPPVFSPLEIETMLTEEQILTAVESEQFNKYENLDRLAFYRGAVWANEQNAAEISELQQANKALSLQNEVLSGAYETAQRRVKELEAEIEKLNSPPDFFTLKDEQ